MSQYNTSPERARQLIEIARFAVKTISACGLSCDRRCKHRPCSIEIEQVQAAADWINEQSPTRRNTYNRKFDSYSYKHMVENWWRSKGQPVYVSNGAFIAAAVGMGWEAAPSHLNAFFKFSPQSVKACNPPSEFH